MSTENTSSCFRLHSHPDKLLKDHLLNVGALAEKIVKSKYIDNRCLFSKIAYLIGISHDFGKATTFFQAWMYRSESTKYARHSFLSALFGYFVIKHYLSKKNKLKQFWYLPGISWLVIVKHHTDIRDLRDEETKLRNPDEIKMAVEQLSNINDNYLDEIKELYRFIDIPEILGFLEKGINLEDLAGEILRDTKRITKESFGGNLPAYYFYILFFYSILLDADKMDSSGRKALPRREKIQSDIIDKYKKREFNKGRKKIDILREEAYKDILSSIEDLEFEKSRILSITLPTGAGKTLTALSLAIKMRDKIRTKLGFLPRIIYCLPFLSIIDQNASVIEEFLKIERGDIPSNLFLKHHHLADISYREIADEELVAEEFNRSLLLTEGWHSEIVITTFVQLFHSMITNKKTAARKFHNMVNSIILLDEVQAIPPKYWNLVEMALEYLAYHFNSWIILMTATQPLIFSPSKIRETVPDKIKYFMAFDRIQYNFNLQKKEFGVFKKEFLERILKDNKRSYMIVLNTVASCRELYEYLKEEFCKRYGCNSHSEKILDEDGICCFPSFYLLNLSTHILPIYRLGRIKRVKSRGPNERMIIVSTQVVEAGVDINVDVVFRDLAPLDCIVQAGGRCNREGVHERGEVNVVEITEDSSEKSFWSYIYSPVLILATKEIIRGHASSVTEKEFVIDAMEKYYGKISERISKDDSRNIAESMKRLMFSSISEFRLIEDRIKTFPILVEINEEAEMIRKQAEEIIAAKRGFERSIEMRKIRNKMSSYTIYTHLKDRIDSLDQIEGLADYFYVRRKELSTWYKRDEGLCLKSNHCLSRRKEVPNHDK